VEHQIGFSKTDKFLKYGGIVEDGDGFGLKYIKRLEGM
jgi:hypothetical protein